MYMNLADHARDKNGLTNKVGWIVVRCYRHADVAEEIHHFIDIAKICGLHYVKNTQYEYFTCKKTVKRYWNESY